jgi:hypothetical protein
MDDTPWRQRVSSRGLGGVKWRARSFAGGADVGGDEDGDRTGAQAALARAALYW